MADRNEPLVAAPRIETPHLCLRPHSLADFAASAALWADEEVTRYIGGRPSTPEEAWSRVLRYAGHWALTGYGFWVVEEKASGAFVGEVGFADFRREMTPTLGGTPEGGWVLMPRAQGQGYATEAVQASLAWAEARFDWPRTACIIEPDNGPSIRVAEKCGFRKVGEGRYRGDSVLLFQRERGAGADLPAG